MTTHSRDTVLLEGKFNIDTEMKDVEVIRVSPDRVLAKGRRYGRQWLLRGLPPEMRHDSDSLRQLCDEFDRRFSSRNPDLPLTVGMEEIEGLGPCIVEEWREDYSTDEGKEGNSPKHRLTLRRALILIAFLIAIAGVLLAGSHIRRMTERSEGAMADLEKLRSANRQSEERMYMLADSLDIVLHGPLISEEFANRVELTEEDEAELMVRSLYWAKIKEFEKELERYDRKVIPAVIDDRPVFLDSICALYRRMMEMAADADPTGRCPQLPEDDRIRLSADLYAGYINNILNYTRVWFPKAYAAFEKKKSNNDS